MSEEITAHEQMLRMARQIGAGVRDKLNHQPMAIPTPHPITGILQTQYIPPPSFMDAEFSLKALGQQSITH